VSIFSPKKWQFSILAYVIVTGFFGVSFALTQEQEAAAPEKSAVTAGTVGASGLSLPRFVSCQFTFRAG